MAPTPSSPTAPATLRLTLNGEPREVPAATTVADLLRELGVAATGVAVERNRQVVRRGDHASTVLADGDVVEIVQFVGGG